MIQLIIVALLKYVIFPLHRKELKAMHGIKIFKKNYMSKQNEVVHSIEFTITNFKLLKEKAVRYMVWYLL